MGFAVPDMDDDDNERNDHTAELTQLRAKVNVYATRHGVLTRRIGELEAKTGIQESQIRAYQGTLNQLNEFIGKLKQDLGATRFLVSLIADAGHVPKSFIDTFMPSMPALGEEDKVGYFDGEIEQPIVAFIEDVEDDYYD